MFMLMLFCCRMESVPEMYAVIVKVEANDEANSKCHVTRDNAADPWRVLLVVLICTQSRSECRLVGRGVLVSRSHISFYLRTGEGELDDMCSSSYRQAWGILLRNVIYYYYSYYYY